MLHMGENMEKDFFNSILNRRSIYKLNKQIPIKDSELIKNLEQIIKNTPSAFNSQSARVVLLLGDNHHKLWNITKECLKKIVPADKFPATENKIASFAAAYGTILYFEEEQTIQKLQQDFPLYKENFPVWSQQANGMLQFAVWTMFAEQNIGANLQHYNPLIDEEVKKTWKLPQSWKLIAQMPFGGIAAQAENKTFLPIEERFCIFY